eukprot:403340299
MFHKHLPIKQPIIKNVKSVDVSPVAHRNIQRIKNGDSFASTTYNIQGLKSQTQNPIDHANISTASSFISNNWRGKSDRFTGGFMNFMFQDNSLQSVARQKNLMNIKLEKLKQIEELQKYQDFEINEKREIIKYYYHQHGGKAFLFKDQLNSQFICSCVRRKTSKNKDKSRFDNSSLKTGFTQEVNLGSQNDSETLQKLQNEQIQMNCNSKNKDMCCHQDSADVQIKQRKKVSRGEGKNDQNQSRHNYPEILERIYVANFYIFLTQNFRTRKMYQPPIKKKIMDKNFQYFESMRKQLLLNAAIIIRYHWIKYKRNKLKKQKKQQVRRQNIIVKARVDTGLGSAMRKMSNNYSSIKKTNSNGLNYSFEPNEYQSHSIVSPMIRQRQFGQEIESPSMRSEMQSQMQGYELQSPMLKLSPYIDKQKQQNQQLILTPQQMLKAQQVSTFANNKSKANLQGLQKTKIGDFELEGPIIEEEKIQSKIQINGQQSTIPQGIQRNQSQAQTSKSPPKTQNPKLKIVVQSKASSPTRLPINNKKISVINNKKPQQQNIKPQPIKLPIQEIQAIDEDKDNSTGISIIQLSTLANIMEQDDEFTPDNRGNLVQNKLQQNIAIEQALLLQDQINENHLDSHDFEKFANRSNFAAGSLEFDKIEEESYSQVGNDEEDEEENYDDEEIKV